MVLLAVAACGGEGRTDPSDVAEITLDTDAVALAASGQTRQLTATTLDADGDQLGGVPVDWSTSDPEIVTVDETGLLVAQGPGTAEVTANVGEVSATAAVVVNSIAALEVFDGNGQTATSGQAVPTAPAVLVTDADGTPVADVRIRFQAGTGSGTVSGEVQTTNAEGVARVGSWRLGSGGLNRLSAAVEGAEVSNEPIEFLATTADVGGYDITVRYLGEYTSSQLLAFAEAELRWERLVTGDVPNVTGNAPAHKDCDLPETTGPFDDLHIFVRLQQIDGPGDVLGQAGPCFSRISGGLTIIGVMQFDVDDVDALDEEGVLQTVILHEMGHVIGFGTLWNDFALVQDSSEADPLPPLADTHFTGAQAIAAFNAAGGTSYSGAKVPVANLGGAGTVNSHWRDEVFGQEVMTGFLSPGFNPLSVITVASLADLGYTVDPSETDPFTLAPALRMAGPRPSRRLVNDIISVPVHQMDLNGRVVGVIRR